MDDLEQFTFNLVDEMIEHVFLRFPGDANERAAIYRSVARQLIEVAADLDLA